MRDLGKISTKKNKRIIEKVIKNQRLIWNNIKDSRSKEREKQLEIQRRPIEPPVVNMNYNWGYPNMMYSPQIPMIPPIQYYPPNNEHTQMRGDHLSPESGRNSHRRALKSYGKSGKQELRKRSPPHGNSNLVNIYQRNNQGYDDYVDTEIDSDEERRSNDKARQFVDHSAAIAVNSLRYKNKNDLLGNTALKTNLNTNLDKRLGFTPGKESRSNTQDLTKLLDTTKYSTKQHLVNPNREKNKIM